MAIRDPLTKINNDLPDNLADTGAWGVILRKILGGDGAGGDPTGVDKWIEDLDTGKASLANANAFTAVQTASAQPRAKVKRSSTQSIANNTSTIVNWDAEDFDVGTLHDNATNNSRITVPVGGAGLWLIGASIHLGPDADGIREIIVVKNGTFLGDRTSLPGFTGINAELQVVAIDAAADADFYEINVLHTAGAALLLQTTSRFWAAKLW